MELLKPKIEDYPARLIELRSDNPDLDFAEAKDIAKKRQKKPVLTRCCCPGTRAKPASRIQILSAAPVISRHGLYMRNQEGAT